MRNVETCIAIDLVRIILVRYLLLNRSIGLVDSREERKRKRTKEKGNFNFEQIGKIESNEEKKKKSEESNVQTFFA